MPLFSFAGWLAVPHSEVVLNATNTVRRHLMQTDIFDVYMPPRGHGIMFSTCPTSVCSFVCCYQTCKNDILKTNESIFTTLTKNFLLYRTVACRSGLPNDNVSMSVGHFDHVLTVYSSMEHVTWKSPGPMCG